MTSNVVYLAVLCAAASSATAPASYAVIWSMILLTGRRPWRPISELCLPAMELNHQCQTIGSLPIWPWQTLRFFCDRDARRSKRLSDKIVHSMVPGRSARGLFTYKAVETMSVNQWATTAWMRDTQWQAQSQGDSSPDHLVVKHQAARRDRQGEKPIAAMWWRCGQKGGRLRQELRLDVTTALSARTSGRSQNGCFGGRMSGRARCHDDHSDK